VRWSVPVAPASTSARWPSPVGPVVVESAATTSVIAKTSPHSLEVSAAAAKSASAATTASDHTAASAAVVLELVISPSAAERLVSLFVLLGHRFRQRDIENVIVCVHIGSDTKRKALA
jgi:hypothetical protein